MADNLYMLKSKRIDISSGQYAIIQEFSGQTPTQTPGASKENIRKQYLLIEKHHEQLKRSDLKSIEQTVQWSSWN